MAMMSPIEPMTTGIWGQGKIKLEEKDDVEDGKVIKVGGKRGWVRQTLDEAVESPLGEKSHHLQIQSPGEEDQISNTIFKHLLITQQ
jgi:hypothetical protein